jgi:hypothetical protein
LLCGSLTLFDGKRDVAPGNRQLPLAAIAQDLTANAATIYGRKKK